jgi:hypothetical protein
MSANSGWAQNAALSARNQSDTLVCSQKTCPLCPARSVLIIYLQLADRLMCFARSASNMRREPATTNSQPGQQPLIVLLYLLWFVSVESSRHFVANQAIFA